MSGDTKLKRTNDGLWMDLDTGKTYAARRLAREARRFQAHGVKVVTPPAPMTSRNVTMVGYTSSSTNSPNSLTPLQSRLFDRMTNRQGVSPDDALEVLLDPDNGYNKAASYGHMRAAGANHSEACIVISLNNPAVSMDYGVNRSLGMDHTDALREALGQ